MGAEPTMPANSPSAPEDLLALMPFSASLGLELQAAVPAEVVGTLAWAPERCTSGGILHGGVLMSLADTLGAVCAYLNLPEGAATSTIESKTNFFRGVRSGVVRGTARPLHVGRSTIVVQTELRDGGDRLVAMVIQTQAVLQPDRR
jgi:1,4-dihydroxy-2-naphthoyl-CoA hydrolase